MFSSILSMLPSIFIASVAAFITWLTCMLWFKWRYVHKNEVAPLQESQHVMQNQYAILAERIKNTDQQLAEAKTKLAAAVAEQKESLFKIAQLEAAGKAKTQHLPAYEWDNLRNSLADELRKCLLESKSTGDEDGESVKMKEQLNAIKQGLKEFKIEALQKINSSGNQYQELSGKLMQIVDLNNKLVEETQMLNKALNTNDQQSDRQLLVVKKRS